MSKQALILLSALSALALCACSKENTAGNGNRWVSLSQNVKSATDVIENFYAYGDANCVMAYGKESVTFSVAAHEVLAATLEYGDVAPSAPQAATAEILWYEPETTYQRLVTWDASAKTCTTETASTGLASTIAASITESNGEKMLTVSGISGSGNAVVAIKDANGTILWSFHIWVPMEEPKAITYSNSQGDFNMLGMYIGALKSAKQYTSGYELSGTLYQWGRKDPLSRPLNVKIENGAYDGTTSRFANPTSSNLNMAAPLSEDVVADLRTSVQNPMTFFTGSSEDGTWINSTDDLWSSTVKTVFDPSPAGYIVAPLSLYSSIIANGFYRSEDNLGYYTMNGSEVKDFFAKSGTRKNAGAHDYVTISSSYCQYVWTADKYSSSKANRLCRESTSTKGKICGYAVRCIEYKKPSGSEASGENINDNTGKW